MTGFPRAYWYLFTGTLVNRLGAFVFTFLALYLTQERHMTVGSAGAIVALYGAGSVASGPVGGVLADRFGCRATLLAAFTMSAGAMLQLGFAESVQHLAFSALLLGFLSEMYRPALKALVADMVRPDQRMRAYGYLYWAVNLGTAGAAALGGLLASREFTLLFIIDAVTTLVFGVIIYFGVTEPRGSSHTPGGRRVSLLAPYRDRVFMLFVAAQFLVTSVFAQFVATLPIDMRAHGITPREYGLLISINGVMICLLQPMMIRLIQRHPRGQVLAGGAILTGAGMGAMAVASSPTAYALTIVLWTLGELTFSPVAPTVVADLAPAASPASYQGTFQMSWGASCLFAAFLGALILERFGSAVLWIGCFATTIVAAMMHLAIAPARRQHLAELQDPQGAVNREDGIADAS